MRAAAATVPLAACLALAGCTIGGESGADSPAVAPTAGQPEAVAKLGFPATATRNTVRIGGGDPVADLAGVVTAVFPATTDENRPHAIALVDRKDWQAAVAASVLNADPLGAPILASDGGDIPAATKDALDQLKPRGADLARDAQVLRVGSKPPAPDGYKSGKVGSGDAYATAAAVDKFSTAVRGKPSPHVIVASGEQAPYAMPAASWAARSGDSVLFTQRKRVPAETLKALKAHDKPDIYVLGPQSVIDPAVEKQL